MSDFRSCLAQAKSKLPEGERLRLFSLHYVANTDIWRAWEYAACYSFTLPEPVLDVGCGDGYFFRLV
jgi:hypothetical protein